MQKCNAELRTSQIILRTQVYNAGSTGYSKLLYIKAILFLICAFLFFSNALFDTRLRSTSLNIVSSSWNNSVALACTASTFQHPILSGAKFLSIEANAVTNYSQSIPSGYYANHGSINVVNTDFCNVSIAYTHPGEHDVVQIQVWLPTDWNGRMMGVGGGGTVAGLFVLSFMAMAGAVGEGYAALSTDAGLPHEENMTQWAEVSPGNINLYLLQDLASVSLNDASIIGKSIVRDYYNHPPKYSYWNGCSQGGRQGMMLAQRYPEAYDGIAAAAPAINWSEFLIGAYYPALTMDLTKEYPHPCEIEAITKAAISACDALDGVSDSVITDPSLCKFDPFSYVGISITCRDTGGDMNISYGAAAAVSAAWSGAKTTDNSFLWYGVSHDSTLIPSTTFPGIISNNCSTKGSCTRSKPLLLEDWIKLFVLKNSSTDLSTMTRAEYENIFHDSIEQYSSIIGTSDPDLRRFRNAGGKMITYHGLADAIIAPGGSAHYYDAATAIDPQVSEYFRLFFAPGVGHCFGGPGAYPDTTFEALGYGWKKELRLRL